MLLCKGKAIITFKMCLLKVCVKIYVRFNSLGKVGSLKSEEGICCIFFYYCFKQKCYCTTLSPTKGNFNSNLKHTPAHKSTDR